MTAPQTFEAAADRSPQKLLRPGASHHAARRHVRICLVVLALLASPAPDDAYAQAALWEPAEYRLSAAVIDMAAVDSPPQRVLSSGTADGRTILTLRTEPRSVARPEQALGPVTFTDALAPYLQATGKIETTSPRVQALAERLFPDDGDLVRFVSNALAWTKRSIRYDPGLAQQIWEGRVESRSAAETLRTRRGTCSEYANVFIAVMRAKGVPAKFVSGFFVGQMYHAWAEVFLPGAEWVPVDPQMGSYGVSNRHIKLFVGVDFPSIGVPLQEIELQIDLL